MYENIKIAVVGAGIAGLAAAYSLFKQGFTQVVILEAQDKIGGRISSLSLGLCLIMVLYSFFK